MTELPHRQERVEKLRRDARYKRDEAYELEAEADELDELANTLERLGDTPAHAPAHARSIIEWADDPVMTLYDVRDIRQALIDLLRLRGTHTYQIEWARRLTDEGVREALWEEIRELEEIVAASA